MAKLYLKKLFFTFLFMLLFLFFSFIVAYGWIHVDTAVEAFLKFSIPDTVGYCITLAITLALDLATVYNLRIDSLKYKEPYKAANKKEDFSFRKDFMNTAKSADSIVHILAFLTLLLPFHLSIALSTQTPILLLLVILLIMLIANGLLFAVFNTLLWYLVHRKWLRN